MNNLQIIAQEALKNGLFTPNEVDHFLESNEGIPLKTFEEWKKLGYNIKKGSKARIKTNLWKLVFDKSEAKSDSTGKFILTPASLFSFDQVEKMKGA